SLLPTSWRTLYELTRVPEPDLEQALANRPAMERKHVAPMLVAPVQAPSPDARDLEQIREELLATPDFTERLRLLKEMERELHQKEKAVSALRSKVREHRSRIAENLRKAVEDLASDRAFTITPQVAEILASVDLPEPETDRYIEAERVELES